MAAITRHAMKLTFLPERWRAPGALVAITTAAWIVTVLLFAATAYADASQRGADASFLNAMQAYAIGFLPWIILAPAVIATARKRIFGGGPIFQKLAEAALLAVVVFALAFLSMVFIYAPLMGIPVSKIAGMVGWQPWIWDIMIFLIAVLSGGVLAATAPRIKAPDEEAAPATIIVKSVSRIDRVCSTVIDAVSAQGNYVALQTKDRELLHRATLREMHKLLEREGFIQVHRSHLVRAREIATFQRRNGRIREVTLQNGKRFPVSPQGAKELTGVLNEPPAQAAQ